MVKLFGFNTSDNFHSRNPFKTFLKKSLDGVGVNEGKVISISHNEKFEVEASKLSEEAFLQIKGSPLSSKIQEVNLIGKEELKEKKLQSDDLLNIYIPLGRALKSGKTPSGIESADNIDKNFLWLKKNQDSPFAFYFDDGDVYMTGYLLNYGEKEVKGSSKFVSPTKTDKVKDGVEEFLLFDIELTIDEKENTFTLDKYETKKGESKEVFFNTNSLTYTSEDVYNYLIELEEYDELDEEQKANTEPPLDPYFFDGPLKLSVVYPVGYVQLGNFIHGKKPSNRKIFLQNIIESKGIGTFELDVQFIDDDGNIATGICNKPNLLTKRIVYLSFTNKGRAINKDNLLEDQFNTQFLST